jgi:hypothetical protein
VTTITTIKDITANPIYQQILRDSFGGVMYNVANRNKYNSAELLAAWNSLSPAERESAGGIVKGAMNFLEDK